MKVHADELPDHPFSPQETDLVRQQVRVPVAKQCTGRESHTRHTFGLSAVLDNDAAAKLQAISSCLLTFSARTSVSLVFGVGLLPYT